MVSLQFLLCCSLLLSGVVFATDADVVEKDPVLIQASKQAAIASISVFNDVMDGKEINAALLNRGIEALANVDGTVPEYGKGFLEKVKEYKEGEPIEKIAASIAVAAHDKFQGKVTYIDDIYSEVGEENIRKFVEGVSKVIKKAIAHIFKKKPAQIE